MGGALVAIAQPPTGLALAPTVGPALAAAVAVLAVLVVVLVLAGALSRDPARQGNAAAMVG